MELNEYLRGQRGRGVTLAGKLEISRSYLSQMASKRVPISPRMAVRIELASDSVVTRRDLFPTDWAEIWPELLEGADSSVAS